jgi:3-oxoadipate enol-lactonase
MIADPGMTTPAMSAAWSPSARVSAMLLAEAALVEAHRGVGNVSADAASAVSVALTQWSGDPDDVLLRGWSRGSAVLGLLDDMFNLLDSAHHAALHFGATSQDIIDSGMMINCADALDIIVEQVRTLIDVLDSHIAASGDRQVVGRTLLQPAVPLTLAARLRSWRDPLVAELDSLLALRVSLPVQLGGPVGTGESVPNYEQVRSQFAEQLLLRNAAPWHTNRRVLMAMLTSVHSASHAAATIAWNLALLAQPELDEVRVRSGGSSAMPTKRNPIDAARARAAAHLAAIALGGMATAPLHDLERALGGWHVEATLVPMCFQAASAAVAATINMMRSADFGPFDRGVEPLSVSTSASYRRATPQVAWALHGPTDTDLVPIVLLHSLGGSRASWSHQTEWLSRHRPVIVIDTRGHGESLRSDTPTSIADLGHDVLDVVTAAGFDRFVVCGISLGGLTGLWLAIHHPDRVAGLIAANTGARIGSLASWAERATAVRSSGLVPIQEAVISRWVDPTLAERSPELFARLRTGLLNTDPAQYAACCDVLRTTDLRRVVAGITVPTLVIGGGLDEATPPSLARYLHAAIPKSQYVEFPNARHIGNVDDVAGFDNAVASFVSQLDHKP